MKPLETSCDAVSSRKPDFWNMTRALCFQPIIGRNQIEGANHERPHRAVAGKWQQQRGSADKIFSPWKLFFDGNFFEVSSFVGFLVSFCWLSFCRKMEVHDPKELLEVIIANESARDLLQSFISETVRPEVSVYKQIWYETILHFMKLKGLFLFNVALCVHSNYLHLKPFHW